MTRRSITHRAPDAARGHSELYQLRKKWPIANHLVYATQTGWQQIMHRKCARDELFGLGNTNLLRRNLRYYLDLLVRNNVTPDAYQRLFVMYIDVWMLKAVNFLIGHDGEGGVIGISKKIISTLEGGAKQGLILQKRRCGRKCTVTGEMSLCLLA